MEHDNNLLKLDICYLDNGLFTDINCLYHLHFVHSKAEYDKSLKLKEKEDFESLSDEIKVLEKEGDYYKALKRMFMLSLIKGKYDKELLEAMNSELGLFYKFITMLNLVVEMLEQTFKPISMKIVKTNLESIKQFGSNIVGLKIDMYLNQLIKIINMKTKSRMIKGLSKLRQDCITYLNSEVKGLM
jgi:hypothetical protein